MLVLTVFIFVFLGVLCPPDNAHILKSSCGTTFRVYKAALGLTLLSQRLLHAPAANRRPLV